MVLVYISMGVSYGCVYMSGWSLKKGEEVFIKYGEYEPSANYTVVYRNIKFATIIIDCAQLWHVFDC